jgi:hypothetical protein
MNTLQAEQDRNYSTIPLEVIVTVCFGFPLSVPTASIRLTTSIPITTSPNTTCRPSSFENKLSSLTVEHEDEAYPAGNGSCNEELEATRTSYASQKLQNAYLRAVRVWSGVGHGQQARLGML